MQDPRFVPPGEIQRRIRGLQHHMASQGVHGALISRRIDLLYFSGCAQNAYLYIPQKHDPILLVRKHAPRARLDSPLPVQAGLGSIRDIPEAIVENGLPLPEVLGMAWDVLPVREFRFFRRLFSPRALVDISGPIHSLRSNKSRWEIDRIAASFRLCATAQEELADKIDPGMSETHLAGRFEAYARVHGHGGGIRVRRPAEDDRSAWLSGEEKAVPGNSPVGVGFRAVINGYHAAIARIHGRERGTPAHNRAADALEAFHEEILSLSAGCTGLKDLRETASFVTAMQKRRPSNRQWHWSLHGIGLELWEPVETTAYGERFHDQGTCVVLETRLQTSTGLVLSLQDTLLVDARGLGRL